MLGKLLSFVSKASPTKGPPPILIFGKYRNWLISDVLKENPSYLVWAYRIEADHGGIDRGTYRKAVKAAQNVFRLHYYSSNEDDWFYPEDFYGDQN